MLLVDAEAWAHASAERLAPFCHRLQVAGSIRRGKRGRECGPADLVCRIKPPGLMLHSVR